MSTRPRKRIIALNLFGIFLAGMSMSVFLIPIAAHGPTLAGIVNVVFSALYALWLGSDIVKWVHREQD